jgi:hypothetical protein
MEKLSLGLLGQSVDQNYQRVAGEENLSQSSLDPRNIHLLLGRRRERWFEYAERVLPWLLAFIFACTTIGFLISDRFKQYQRPEEVNGFRTDFCTFHSYVWKHFSSN